MTHGPRIYFAAVNTSNLCEAFRSERVLETFADVRPLMDRYRPLFHSMALDSGAFSEMTTGKPIDLSAFIDFCHAHGRFYDFIASLDSITGGPDVNVSNWRTMLDRGVDAIPTFHQGESLSLLKDYCVEAPMIGLGFQRPIKDARPWLDQCFNVIPSTVRVHGWGMTNYTDLPFWSVDSRTWFFEVRALLAVKGQGSASLGCLTTAELIEIVKKKYLRLPLRARWDGVDVEDISVAEGLR